MCCVSPITCCMSLTPTANATDPPLITPQYAQQDAAADLNLDQSTMSLKDPKINLSPRGELKQFFS